MKRLLTVMRAGMMLAAVALAEEAAAQQLKVDISITNRQAQEVQEPGYALWQAAQGKTTSMEFAVEGEGQSPITCTLLCADDSDYEVRTGWSKTYIQNATYKGQNGRLTFDGVSLDPRTFGSFTLRIEGLPAGQHTIQTYHNCWENPTAFYAAPMTVKLNGTVVHENVLPSFLQAVAANAVLLVTSFTIENDGDAVELEFITSADNPGKPDNGQANEFQAPVLNGFELNTADITVQAKEPYPANNDMHADCDGGSVTLSWTPANGKVREHRLYFGASEDDLTLLATVKKTGSDVLPQYTVNDLYSGNTYYWRVDEVTASPMGKEIVSEGAVWLFKPRQLAFPEAEGYGRFALGGRGGSVYHVTSLSNENVPGTLKYGLLLDEPHTIVFDVSGIIDMGFEAIFTKPNITIAAQTAPGKGICLKASNINIGSDNIARFVRFKRGLGVYGENTGNAMGMSGADHSIVDHCTAAWGTDETVSGRGAKNITFQYSGIFEALGITGHKNYSDGTNHGYAATIDGQKGSWHHNLLLNCEGRNWSMGGGMDGQNRPIGGLDLFNNVCYNWHGRTTDGNCHAVNFVNNYYKMGPDTSKKLLFTQDFEGGIAEDGIDQAYVNGNIRENKDHSLTIQTKALDKKNDIFNARASNGGKLPTTYEYQVSEPLFESFATIHTAKDAMKIVTSYGGAIMPMRDEQHQRVVRETLDGTWTYRGSKSGIRGEIDNEADITDAANGGWEEWPEETRPEDWDTDQDGMPDWWERCVNSDPQNANNNDDPNGDGWTLLEDYLEFMAHPYVILKPNGSSTIDLQEHFAGFFGQNGKAVTPTFSLEENMLNGLYTVSIDGTTLTVSATKPNTESVGNFRVSCTDGETTFTQRLGVAITGNSAGRVGDVNGDGSVDVADIAAVIDVMAGTSLPSGGAGGGSADVNGDGTVDVADIAAIIDIMAAI
ncbi:MAG: dockerin type I repeat-containing protein [Prevotella sp.]|nr:dockerin type I repeat-containing protein [Prevotella sp.]